MNLLLSGEAKSFSFAYITDFHLLLRDNKAETHPENVKKYMNAVKNEFKDFPSLQIIDARNEV